MPLYSRNAYRKDEQQPGKRRLQLFYSQKEEGLWRVISVALASSKTFICT